MNHADTPLLLMVWRRPHTLRQLIDAIRPVAPTRLYVACDGPNPDRPGEAEKVAATRAVIEIEIDWPCQIERLYSETNQGCRLGPSRAISWFFGQVEEGIILEDDCVPHPDFLSFCAELLEKYRHDERVFLITGHNREGVTPVHSDYFFSRLGGIWGWASWRRAWQKNVLSIPMIEESRRLQVLESLVPSEIASERYARCLDSLAGRLDAWDYEWGFCRLVNSGLCCVPRLNLISNIGLDVDATHTLGMEVIDLAGDRFNFPLSPPLFVVPLKHYDSLYGCQPPSSKEWFANNIHALFEPLIGERALAKFKKLVLRLARKTNLEIRD